MKGKKRKHRNKKKQQQETRKYGVLRTILTLIVAAAVLTAGVTVVAEFVKSYRAKRVIAAYASDGMLFSSNYLHDSALVDYATIYVDKLEAESGSTPYFDATVTVCNFAQANPVRAYGRTINYTLTASIVTVSKDGSGNQVITPAAGVLPAVKINGAAMLASYSGSLASGAARTDEYELSLPRSMLTGDKYYVLLTATPTGDYADLQPISALFELAIKSEGSSVSWTVEPTDVRSNSIGDYAGYNFRLSGSGRGTVMLGWDGTKLDISKMFKEKVSATTPSAGDIPAALSGLTVIEFDVDADSINSYDIQFYPHTETSVSSWSDVAVQMTFVEDTT